MDDEDMGPSLMPVDEDDDGYVSPEFDLPPDSDEEDTAPPPAKRARANGIPKGRNAPRTVEDDEELALRLLRGS